jgi:hypothetical protein
MSNQNSPDVRSQGRDSLLEHWWAKILASGLFFFMAYYLNNFFLEIETGVREPGRVNAFVWFAYMICGRNAVVVFFGALGGLFLIWGVGQLIRKLKA